ncbi:hypothetical protein [Actinacidiphila glaucinigra]|uniref:hypothetical protein n=1 Tax=Actinacidiphila glaucinigra TaxID=235986 RepID=UPI0029A3D2E4|nr:hypothetical protein [Streptomyces sp. PA03-3a]
MWWLYLYVGLATAGLLVLGFLAVRVYAEVRGLARQVGRSSDRLLHASEDLRRAAEPLVRGAGDLSR